MPPNKYFIKVKFLSKNKILRFTIFVQVNILHKSKQQLLGKLNSNLMTDCLESLLTILENRLKMTFLHAEVLDIRARARQLQKLLNWENEGPVVDHWIENCSMLKKLSRLALGRYLKRYWQRELERQRTLRQSKPAFANKWQPPRPELLEGNRVRCNEGSICYALNVISQWHNEYRFVIGSQRQRALRQSKPAFLGVQKHSRVPAL